MSNEINDSSKYPLFVQTYSSHPFVDVYSTMCSKEIGGHMINNAIAGSLNV
jgi:hypothetical protein